MLQHKKQLSQEEIAIFCRQIAMVVKAGLSTSHGISILRDEAVDENIATLLSRIYDPLAKGSSFHSALEATGVFPHYVVHMVELGEITGHLEEVLLSLSNYYERESQFRDSIKKAVSYPLLMTLMMIVVIFVVLTRVVPVFSQINTELGSKLSPTAHTLMKISTALDRYTVVLIVLFILFLIAGSILFHTDLGRILFLGEKTGMAIAASRFANCMYLALSSGLGTEQGLELADVLVNNPHMQARIARCRKRLQHGETIESALLHSGIFSRMYASWIAIGYKTGNLADVMKQIMEAYEKETDARLSRIISVLEPTLIIILCVFIGQIIISFLLPLLGIMTGIA